MAISSRTNLPGAAVRNAAKKYLVPEKMIVVIVGDRAKTEPGLKALNLGAIEWRDADGNLIKK